ncbi:MAG: hypothetical protein ACKO8G_07790 [Actinomycetota bacterium]
MFERPRHDGRWLLVVATALLLWFLGPFLLIGHRFPLGPDAPVYLWWARLAGVDGLSAVPRPGVAALALALSRTLGAPIAVTFTAIEVVGGVAVGLAAGALVRLALPRDRTAWPLAALLAGTFAVHIAAGYVANLVFAAAFLAAAAALATAERRGVAAAAVLLGAAGLAHPLFAFLGAAILLVAAAMAAEADRDEALRVVWATVGGAALLGGAWLTLLVGPGPHVVDSSRDAFLRRAGLRDLLRAAYLDRFLRRWPRYVPWLSAPLALAALPKLPDDGFVGRFLRAWGVVVLGGIALALATRWLPPDRFLAFAFVLPILAAIGALRIARARRGPRILARAAAGGLVVAMLAGAGIAWARQIPYLTETEVARLAVANAIAATRPGTGLVFVVGSEPTAFSVTRIGSVVRAAVPPDRIRDVILEIAGSSPGAEGEALDRIVEEDERVAIAAHDRRIQRILVVPFARRIARGAPWSFVSTGVYAEPAPGTTVVPRDPLVGTGAAATTRTVFAALVLLLVVGTGWARLVIPNRVGALAIALPCGMAALVLAYAAFDRAGLAADGRVGAIVASALAAGLGHLARILDERRRAAEATA